MTNGARQQQLTEKNAMNDWSTNTTIEEIAARLRVAHCVALLTHARPDGDAIGSTLALARTLIRLDITATPIYFGPWSHRFDSMVADTPVEHVGALSKALPTGQEPDIIAVIDTGSWSQLSDVREWLEPRSQRAVIMDHHLHGDAAVASSRLIDTGASAAAQIVTKLCLTLLDLEDASALPVDVAAPLYVGLATDTGWFRHSNVTPDVLKLGAMLLEAGVDHASIYESVEHADAPARLRIIARALASLELFGDERVAVMRVTQRDMDESGAGAQDSGGMSDLPMCIGSVRVCCVLTELSENLCKVSLRSKPPSDSGEPFVNVNQVAMSLGGGGHAQAAGAKIEAPIEEAKRRVVDALLSALT